MFSYVLKIFNLSNGSIQGSFLYCYSLQFTIFSCDLWNNNKKISVSVLKYKVALETTIKSAIG